MRSFFKGKKAEDWQMYMDRFELLAFKDEKKFKLIEEW